MKTLDDLRKQVKAGTIDDQSAALQLAFLSKRKERPYRCPYCGGKHTFERCKKP